MPSPKFQSVHSNPANSSRSDVADESQIDKIQSRMRHHFHRDENTVIAIYQQFQDLTQQCDICSSLMITASTNLMDYDTGYNMLHPLINDIENHSVELVSAAIYFYGAIGHFKTALNIFESDSKWKTNLHTLTAMASVLCAHHRLEKALALYKPFDFLLRTKLVVVPFDEESTILLLRLYRSIGDFENGRRLIAECWDSINGGSEPLVAAVISFYGEISDMHAASSLYYRAQSLRSNESKESNPSPLLLTKMMRCYLQNNQATNGLKFLL